MPLKSNYIFSNNISRFKYKNLITALLKVKSKSMDEAIELSHKLCLLISFIQQRNVHFTRCYKYKEGKRASKILSKLLNPINNNNLDLLKGNINVYLDICIDFIYKNSGILNELLRVVHSTLLSLTHNYIEFKFIALWLPLEKLAIQYYNIYFKDKNKEASLNLFKRRNEIKDKLVGLIESNFNELDQKSKNILKGIIKKSYLYEHDTQSKINIFITKILFDDFDKSILEDFIKNALNIRTKLSQLFL